MERTAQDTLPIANPHHRRVVSEQHDGDKMFVSLAELDATAEVITAEETVFVSLEELKVIAEAVATL
ncbi:hypothetical protein BGX26_003618 [Mortierella sp. AD094]|nr:hypothetical protein BGX26_003618 [Mortierella sp. AD094]